MDVRKAREFATTVLVQKWGAIASALKVPNDDASVEAALPRQASPDVQGAFLFFKPLFVELEYVAPIRDYYSTAAGWAEAGQPFIRNPETLPPEEREAFIVSWKIVRNRLAILAAKNWHFEPIRFTDIEILAPVGLGVLGIIVLLILVLRR